MGDAPLGKVTRSNGLRVADAFDIFIFCRCADQRAARLADDCDLLFGQGDRAQAGADARALRGRDGDPVHFAGGDVRCGISAVVFGGIRDHLCAGYRGAHDRAAYDGVGCLQRGKKDRALFCERASRHGMHVADDCAVCGFSLRAAACARDIYESDCHTVCFINIDAVGDDHGAVRGFGDAVGGFSVPDGRWRRKIARMVCRSIC